MMQLLVLMSPSCTATRLLFCRYSEPLLRRRISSVIGRQALFLRRSSSSSSSDDTEWIPPSRPLSGDQANYEHIIRKSHLSHPKIIMEENEEQEREESKNGNEISEANTDAGASPWTDYGEASQGEDEEEDFDDIPDEELLNPDNWIDPFQRGNLSKNHYGEAIDVDEWAKCREEDFIDEDELEGEEENTDKTEDQLLKEWFAMEKKKKDETDHTLKENELLVNNKKMTEEEFIASAKEHGTWIDLDELTAEDLQRIVDEMGQRNQASSPLQKSQEPVRSSSSNISSKTEENEMPDWTVARQKRLSRGRPSAMLTPQDAKVARQLDGEIPVKFHTLLTCEEITNCLQSLGGWDVVVLPIPDDANMGKAIIVATGTSGTHLRTMADALVRSLRARKLHKMGVVGADSGAEGYDCDDWIAIDCRNYTVHLQNEITRKHIALEHHWSPNEVSKRRRNPIKFDDDDAMDDFVHDNPIPDEYARQLFNSGSSNTMTAEEVSAVSYLNTKKLQRTTVQPVVPSRRRPKGGKKATGSKGKRG